MKKSIIYAGVILAASFTLTNCTKEVNAPETNLPEGIPFEIIASSSDTKTTVEGLSTKWAADDAINVFHAAAGTTTYTSDKQFTIAAADLATGRFTGSLSEVLSDGAYDWYAFYPYSKYNKTPAGVSQETFGFTTIGGTSQTQNGNDNMDHLCGKACPLYGIADGVAYDGTPSIKMHHLTSIIKVNVTNNSGTPLTVSSVSFTGSEDIVGTYYINFAGSPVVYTERGSSDVSNTASLSVKNGKPIASNSSATFYLAVKPFTANSGDKLKLSVNGYEKEITLSKTLAFTAGHIKTLSFEVDKAQTVFYWDLSVDSTSEATEEKIAWTASWGDMVCERAAGGTKANNYYPGTSGKNYTSTRFYSNSTLSITPKAGNSLTYYVFEATTEKFATDFASSTWTNATTDLDGKKVTVIADDPNSPVSVKIGATCGFTMVECHTEPAVFPPVVSVSPSSLDVPSAGAVPTVRYSIKRPIDGGKITAKSDKDWVNSFDYSVDGEISFVVDENAGEARTANITVSYPGAEDVIIVVSQDEEGAAPEPKSYEWDLTKASNDWTKNGCVDYFSQPYGIKKANAYIINKSINDFTLAPPSKISVSVKSLQNGGTTSILTVYLVDSNGTTIGEGIKITPVNASDASKTTYQEVVFDSNLSGATGIMVKCTSFGKNILINGVKYTVTY